MRLSQLLDEYSARKLLGQNTRRLYAVAIRHYSKILIRPAEVGDLTDANLAVYAARRIERKRAAASIAGEQAKLLALWRFAAREGHVAKWPTVRTVRVPERIPRAWTRDELRILFAATNHAARVGHIDGRTWWTALFLVLYDTAERIEAVLSIEWGNVDMPGRTITVPAEHRKGKTRDRLYRIAKDTAEWLDKIPRVSSRPFDWPYCHGTLYHRFKRMLAKVGLPNDRRSMFHRIRRTTASHYEAAGGNAMELLDHSSRKVTKAYLDPSIVQQKQAIDLLFRPGE